MPTETVQYTRLSKQAGAVSVRDSAPHKPPFPYARCNPATARITKCWDDLDNPETARKVVRAFDDAHFVPADALEEWYFHKYRRALGKYGGEGYENGLHPQIHHALLTSTSPKPPLLSLVHLTNSVSPTPFTFLTLTSRAPPSLRTKTPIFRILVSRLRILCSHDLRDPDLLHDMYQRAYGQVPPFPMNIIADDGISKWGYVRCWDDLVQKVMGGLEFETDRNEDNVQSDYMPSVTDCEEEVLMEGTVLVENLAHKHPFPSLPPPDPKPLPKIPAPWHSKYAAKCMVKSMFKSQVNFLADSPPHAVAALPQAFTSRPHAVTALPHAFTVLPTKRKTVTWAADAENLPTRSTNFSQDGLRSKRSKKMAKAEEHQAQSRLMSANIVQGWLSSQVPYFNRAMAGELIPLRPVR
ncbi:hypothetical protein BC936DRAFT_139765 [Jimgerdemannia flammicorona]|uniref:Uncharacterized protein n=1 Tax=Jimgerdemannia flammicorona TaxID=994334 RepID=A0A433B9A9_9FUNG|nr:hypothetical protein BC936DRAFT_139765 [Jimgerdemannia flammicorona]